MSHAISLRNHGTRKNRDGTDSINGATDGMRRPAQVRWEDLVSLRPGQVALNLGLSAPWLAGSLWAAQHDLYWLAMPLSAAFFLTALRQAHDSYHASIGVPRRWLDAVLLALTFTMLCSTHAIRHTHLVHHRDPLGDGDEEGGWARQPGWRALALGVLFSIRTHAQALRTGSPRTRRWVGAELTLIAAVCLTAALTEQAWLRYHAVAMIGSNMLVGFFAVWSVHHGCDPKGVFARTERRAWVNGLTVHLLFHIEHHLYPAVPANHLPILASRLDAVAPEWAAVRVLGAMKTSAPVRQLPHAA
ncbi:MAG: fatty acid desaturase [Polaromonas sp.]|uniref:fatty acid desaturase n=1 Tax=Polaromonas sp. TaxID=1869339 RepID=UPI003265D656